MVGKSLDSQRELVNWKGGKSFLQDKVGVKEMEDREERLRGRRASMKRLNPCLIGLCSQMLCHCAVPPL